MKISWDISANLFSDAEGVDLQQTKVRPKSKTIITVIALTVGSIVASTEKPVIITQGLLYSSSPIIRVWSEKQMPEGIRGTRRAREKFAPDAREGLSTVKLAGTFSQLFAPSDEEESETDYSFG